MYINIFANEYICFVLLGEEVISHWDIYRSGPYGNVGGRHGEYFHDFRDS